MKIYNNDSWSYKMGLVGFDNIIRHNREIYNIDVKKYNYKVCDDYIEFDESLLKEFHHMYFNYFFDKYNVASDIKNKLSYFLEVVKNEEKFKDGITDIKRFIKKYSDKIKKYYDDEFNECSNIYNEICKIKNNNQIEDIKNLLDDYFKIISKDKINKKLTQNMIVFMLGQNFFGQVSFFNLCNSSKNFNELKEVMYNDYIKPIIEHEEFKRIIKLDDENKLEEYILNSLNSEDSNINKDLEKLLKNIKKSLFGKKRKVESIDKVLEDLNECIVCEKELSLGLDMDESTFLAIGISSKNNLNAYWDFNIKQPICSLCRLVYLCNPAGCTKVFKGYLDDKYEYEDKIYYGFVSIDGILNDIITTNKNFAIRSSKNASFEEYIIDSIIQNTKISEWQLQNILYIEFNTKYLGNTKLNYLNIPSYIAKFLKNQNKLFEFIKNNNLRYEIFDILLRREDLKYLTDKLLRMQLKEESKYNYPISTIIKIRYYLRYYKGEIKMNEKENIELIKSIRKNGFSLAAEFRGTNQENKINSIAYRLLNATKANDKDEFRDILLRLFMSYNRTVPKWFSEIINEENHDFAEIAHSFIAGFISKEFKKEEDE